MELGKNIYTFRKEKNLSQEKLAEKVNVTRQTISNWELGETSPNPEQLMLLSNALNKSIDELVGNNIPSVSKKDCSDNAADSAAGIAAGNTEAVIRLYIGFIILCGTIAGIWSFSANRFRPDEMLLLTGAGMIIGFCVAAVCHNILKFLKK